MEGSYYLLSRKAILACKYGFNKLKSEAQFTVENVIDVFLKADGNNCVILREAAKKYMSEHGEEMLESESFDRLRESGSLWKEVMAAVIRSNKKGRTD